MGKKIDVKSGRLNDLGSEVYSALCPWVQPFILPLWAMFWAFSAMW